MSSLMQVSDCTTYISAVRVAHRSKDNYQRNPQNITRIIIVKVVIDATSFILFCLFWPLAEQKFEMV